MAIITYNDNFIEVKDKENIANACEKLGVTFSCYEGECGICEIKILKGHENLSELTKKEKLMGMTKKKRLACQCQILKGNVEIEI